MPQAMPSQGFVKLLLRGLPESTNLPECLAELSLTSLYTQHNAKQKTGWIALSPVPLEDALVPLCKLLIATTHAELIEKAPLQRIPRSQTRRDPTVNTIESDPHYQAFLETLAEDGSLKPPVKPAFDPDAEVVKPKEIPPIVAFLADRERKPRSGPAPVEADSTSRVQRRKKPKKKKDKKKKHDEFTSEQRPSQALPKGNRAKPDVSGGGVNFKILSKQASGAVNDQPNDGSQHRRPPKPMAHLSNPE
uniref:UPF3 domain-containing protein n=1 Tax=Spongospora subterranea TaxID=70186 RepID=A0A0H5R6Z0_9EUKA|eukprot:CRZ09878.1 hypothetical protein [Spongospora subterranea]